MSGAPPRALVVEDDRAWQDILSEILAETALTVDVAQTVEGAIRLLRDTPHRIAVVDLALSDGPPQDEGGLTVLDAIRRYDPGCTSLLLTGFATVELAVSALGEYGAYTCLRKESFRRSEFRALVGRILAVAPPTESSRRNGVTRGDAAAVPEYAVGSVQGERVLLVEDDAGWRSLLAELLCGAGHQVRVALSYGEALGYLRRETFGLAVVDLGLASSVSPHTNRDGYRVLNAANQALVPALVVSGAAAPSDVEYAYAQYGIFAYLEKQGFDKDAFLSISAEALASGRAPFGEVARLTRRERDVLALVARGLTNKGIAHELTISENTVKRYLKSVFVKLGVDNRAAAATMAAAAGIR
jgi:DNA-binding NarL/FixJ family response regulator